MRKPFYHCCVFFFCILFCGNSFGQFSQDVSELTDIAHHWELSVTAGANNFLGDLGGTKGKGKPFAKDYVFKTLHPLGGVSVTYYRSAVLGIRAGFNYTMVSGADSLIENTGDLERWRWYRNLSFKSSIFEGYITADIYPVMIFDKTTEIHQMSPFISVGVGFFHFNPRTQLNGSWVNLQPLRLEGQGFPEYPDRQPYKLTQLYIPVNVGIKYYLSDRLAITGGFNFRHTFTDYIDDISTTYIDPALFDAHLPANDALLAKQLYSRSRTPWKVKPDVEKAHNNDNDSYVTFFLSLSIRFNRYVQFYYGGQ